jgi:hypothetical protein
VEDLFSLQFVLADESRFSELASFCNTMALWNVFSTSEAAPEGKDCKSLSAPNDPPTRLRHRFELASPKAVSSRVYRIDYVSCRNDVGEYEVEVEPAGFRSDFSRRQDPVLTSFHGLNVFKLAINDLGVLSNLVKMLRDRPVTYCSVTEPAEGAGQQDPLFFHFVAADGVPGKPGTKTVIKYLAEYNPVTKTAVFTPEEE